MNSANELRDTASEPPSEPFSEPLSEPWIDSSRLTEVPLILPLSVRAWIHGWCRRAYPAGARGFLLGQVVPHGVAIDRATHVDPVDGPSAEEMAARHSLSVIGTWTARPRRSPCPTRADHAAARPDESHLIVTSSRRGAEIFRSWRMVHGTYREEEILEGPDDL